MKKITKAAKSAKKDGYKYMTSVVGNKFNTVYHHVIKIDDVIKNGWSPAPYHYNGWKIGVTTANLPGMSINKSLAISKYCK